MYLKELWPVLEPTELVVAQNGLDARIDLLAKHWILDRPGDFVFVQKGHKDDEIKSFHRALNPGQLLCRRCPLKSLRFTHDIQLCKKINGAPIKDTVFFVG